MSVIFASWLFGLSYLFGLWIVAFGISLSGGFGSLGCRAPDAAGFPVPVTGRSLLSRAGCAGGKAELVFPPAILKATPFPTA